MHNDDGSVLEEGVVWLEEGSEGCKESEDMITIQDLYNILDNKIANEAQKTLIRNNMPPQIAERMCAAIDGHEKAELFKRILNEYNEWLLNQQRQQAYVQEFLREYYK